MRALAVIFAAILAIASLAASALAGSLLWICLVVGVVAAVGLAVVPLMSEQRAERDRERADNAEESALDPAIEMRLLMFETLGPVARAVARMAPLTPAKRGTDAMDALKGSLAAALGLVAGEDKRATIFVRRTDPDGIDVFAPHEALSSGRGDPPVSRFRPDSTEGQEVWRAAGADEPRFCRDLDTDPPPGLVSRPMRRYKTFITVPITYRDEPVGLLTVNALKAGELDERDTFTMQTIAALAAAVYGLLGERWPGVGGA